MLFAWRQWSIIVLIGIALAYVPPIKAQVTSGSVTILDGRPSATPPARRFPRQSDGNGQTRNQLASQRVLTATALNLEDAGQSQEPVAADAAISGESLVFEYAGSLLRPRSGISSPATEPD